MAVVLLLIGAALTVAGTALVSIPAALIVAGVLCIAGGVDLARSPEPTVDEAAE